METFQFHLSNTFQMCHKCVCWLQCSKIDPDLEMFLRCSHSFLGTLAPSECSSLSTLDDNLPTTHYFMSSGKSPPDRFPEPPSCPGHTPWSADIIDGHNTLKAAHDAVSRALNLDESDPIRLRHHEKQIKTVMLSTLQALATQRNPPLPERYVEDAANSIRQLAGSVAIALNSCLKG